MRPSFQKDTWLTIDWITSPVVIKEILQSFLSLGFMINERELIKSRLSTTQFLCCYNSCCFSISQIHSQATCGNNFSPGNGNMFCIWSDRQWQNSCKLHVICSFWWAICYFIIRKAKRWPIFGYQRVFSCFVWSCEHWSGQSVTQFKNSINCITKSTNTN